jgi:hypothetical protein
LVALGTPMALIRAADQSAITATRRASFLQRFNAPI